VYSVTICRVARNHGKQVSVARYQLIFPSVEKENGWKVSQTRPVISDVARLCHNSERV
jgi:hypothetical protein